MKNLPYSDLPPGVTIRDIEGPRRHQTHHSAIEARYGSRAAQRRELMREVFGDDEDEADREDGDLSV